MVSGSRPQFGERAEYGADDVCFRHPETHSFTLCQRCGRTICPKCQVQSAVGVLCTDCVKATQPSTARRFGRGAKVTARRLGGEGTPTVTYTIMILCGVVFVAQLLSRYFGGNAVTEALWYAPLYSLPSDLSAYFGFEPWRMLTVMFTHSTGFIMHILFNMYALWLFGPNLERILGRAAFLTLYLFAGVGGALGVMYWVYIDPATINIPTVGASGAIFGVLAATLVAYKAANINIRTLGILIAINFGIGLLPGAAISWQAHLGGMIVGAVTAWLLLSLRGPRKRTARIAALSGLGVLLVILACGYLVALPG